MPGKWLTPFKGNRLGKQKTSTVLPGKAFDERMAAFRKERGLSESFSLTTYCTPQRTYVVTVFERFAASELFRAVRTEPVPNTPQAGSMARSASLTVATAELSGWRCVCGRGSYVRCCCGITSCRGEREDWKCPGCGASGDLEPLHEIGGSKSSAAKTSLLTSPSPLLLSKR